MFQILPEGDDLPLMMTDLKANVIVQSLVADMSGIGENHGYVLPSPTMMKEANIRELREKMPIDHHRMDMDWEYLRFVEESTSSDEEDASTDDDDEVSPDDDDLSSVPDADGATSVTEKGLQQSRRNLRRSGNACENEIRFHSLNVYTFSPHCLIMIVIQSRRGFNRSSILI